MVLARDWLVVDVSCMALSLQDRRADSEDDSGEV